MTRYAAETSVSTDKSRAEIERILMRYNASHFMYGWSPEGAMIMFQAKGRRIRFLLPLPDRNDRAFTHTSVAQQLRTKAQAQVAWEQAGRQRWRALALIIKAKLEAVEAGITSFEDEFLANTLLPDGQSVGQWIEPQIARVYLSGSMPAMLPMLEGNDDY